MQQLFYRLSPLFFFLLLFACAKDNEWNALEEKAPQEIEAKAKHPCFLPCSKPDYFTVKNITCTAATLDWGYDWSVCGTFKIFLENLETGEVTYLDASESPVTLTHLDKCSRYTVGISHITDKCASIPLELSFKTSCKKCKRCNIKCEDPDFVAVDVTSMTTATVDFGFNTKVCGYFIGRLTNNATSETTTINPATAPLELSDLDPCTSYTIGLSHVTDMCAKLPTEITFTTLCENPPCAPVGLDASSIWLSEFGLHIPDFYDWTQNGFGYEELDYTAGYQNIIDPILSLEANEPFASIFCPMTADGLFIDFYFQIWIDYNDNGVFDPSELVTDYAGEISAGICVSETTTNWPTEGVCGVPARILLSANTAITSPCEDIAEGQVIDFLVNVGDCTPTLR